MSADGDFAGRRIDREIELCYPALRALLKRLTGDVQVAQELCQDSIVRLMEQRQPILDVRAWLFRTATHLAWDWLRHQRVARDHAALQAAPEASGADASRVVQAREALVRLSAAITALPQQARRVFELSRFGELSQREIAERLGIERKTVENHLTRALACLARALGDDRHDRH